MKTDDDRETEIKSIQGGGGSSSSKRSVNADLEVDLDIDLDGLKTQDTDIGDDSYE